VVWLTFGFRLSAQKAWAHKLNVSIVFLRDAEYLLVGKLVADRLVELFEVVAVTYHPDLVSCGSCRTCPVEVASVWTIGSVVPLGKIFVKYLCMLMM